MWRSGGSVGVVWHVVSGGVVTNGGTRSNERATRDRETLEFVV